MAVQNVLNGSVDILSQIISDLKEHQGNKEKFEGLNDSIKELNKNIEATEKSINDEIAAKIKDGTNAVAKGFNTSVSEEKAKLKDVYNKREKAKSEGVRLRINEETGDLRANNDSLQNQIAEAFKEYRIPRFCSSRLFYSNFMAQGLVDRVIFLLQLIVLYIAIPLVLTWIPSMPARGMIIYYFAVTFIYMICVRVVYGKYVIPYYDIIYKARMARYEIENNNKKVNSIKRHIRKDKSEEKYDLSAYDIKINSINDRIRDIEEQREKAIADFNATTKAAIISEVRSRYAQSMKVMKTQLEESQISRDRLDAVIKDQRAYITSNYEAVLGKDFMDVEILSEVKGIMTSGEAATISQAIAKYKEMC